MSDFGLYLIAAMLVLNFVMHLLNARDGARRGDDAPRRPIKRRGAAPKMTSRRA